jgi:hypothetical protein
LTQICSKSGANDSSSIEKLVADIWLLCGCFEHARPDPMNDTYIPSAELRLKAEACHRAPLRAEDNETRATLLSLMAAWREIAGQVGRVEQADRGHRRAP